MTRRAPIGDRLEQVIEQRADVETEIHRGEEEAGKGGSLRRTIFWLAVTGVSLYLVAPSLTEVLGSWRDIEQVAPAWLVAMAALQLASLACLWALQRLALRERAWRPVITSQLAGNALAKVAPGGGALGAALQYRMLVQSGVDRGRAAAGLTAANLLVLGVVLALPVLALPTLLRGSVDRSLVEATLFGLGVFAVLAGLGTWLLASDTALAAVGRAAQATRNRLRRRAEPLRGLPERLLRERNHILDTIGPRWKRALLATVGRWAFDYATLLAALAAVGSRPRPALVLGSLLEASPARRWCSSPSAPRR